MQDRWNIEIACLRYPERKILAFSLRKMTIFALSVSVTENKLQVLARKSGGGQKPLLDPHWKSGGQLTLLTPCFCGLFLWQPFCLEQEVQCWRGLVTMEEGWNVKCQRRDTLWNSTVHLLAQCRKTVSQLGHNILPQCSKD